MARLDSIGDSIADSIADSIGIVVFPMDQMESIGLLSNPSPLKESQNIVYTSGFILLLDFR